MKNVHLFRRRLLLPAAAMVAAAWLAGCAGQPPAEPAVDAVALEPATEVETAGPSRVLSCEWLAPFAVRPLADGLRVEMPLREVVLPRVEAASGERYADAALEVWLKGSSALYRGAGETAHRECTARPAADPWQQAALRGVSFRALGQEPGWVFEVVPQRWLRVVADYGRTRLLLPPAAPRRDGNVTRYDSSADGRTLAVLVEQVPCRDAMSGLAFDASVTLTLDGRVYRGCGQTLP